MSNIGSFLDRSIWERVLGIEQVLSAVYRVSILLNLSPKTGTMSGALKLKGVCSNCHWLSSLVLMVCGLVRAGAADVGILGDPGYLVHPWEAADGLPENSATAITQTPDGYLWFGAFNGLVRVNGVDFKVFNPANTPEPPSAGVVNLHTDKSGGLLVSTYRGGT